VEDGQGEAFFALRGMEAKRTGEGNDAAVADADRAEHSEAAFGQTYLIETAVDVPAWRIKG